MNDENLIPGWLAFLVLGLLLAVAAIAGYIARDAIVRNQVADGASSSLSRLEQSVSTDPADLTMRLQLAYAYQEEGRWADALTEYEQILALEPNDTAALYNKGVVLLELGDTDQAEGTLLTLLGLAPDHVLAAKALGQHYVETERYHELLALLAPVIEQRPQYGDLQYLVGLAHEKLGEADAAITHYEAALTYAPDLVEARDGLARLGSPAPTSP